MSAPLVLIVEDDPGHVRLIQKNLGRAGLPYRSYTFEDGQKILDYLMGDEARDDRDRGVPFFLLLDLRLPKVDGMEVLRQIKSHPELKRIPVTVFTTSDDPDSVQACYDLGCSYYLVKPADYEKFSEVVLEIGKLAGMIKLPAISGKAQGQGQT